MLPKDTIFAHGHDFGNSETCSVTIGRGVQIERRIPSITSIGSMRSVETIAGGAGKDIKDLLQANHYILEYDKANRHIEKYVGQKVFDDGAKPLETRGDSSRYWVNTYNLEMLMVNSASVIPDQIYGLHVVTGLPIHDYSPEHAELVKQALTGEHCFRLNGRERIMHVLSVKCIMEGAGALIAYGSNNPDELQGVIDIGGHTTDLFVARGQKPRQHDCRGVKRGVAAAAERFAEKFKAAYGHVPTLEAQMQLLRQHIHGEPYRIMRDQTRKQVSDFALREMLESSLREVGQEIATQVAAAWDDITHELARILIVGGGAHYFEQDIQVRFDYAKKAYKPEMANATGYGRLAEAIVQRAHPIVAQRSV